jgi:Carboxypeptidase regulatory-like domain
LCVLLSFLIAMPASVAAQTATGTVSGTVRDATGAVLPGVTITIRSAATGASRVVVTDADGRYRIASVDPGDYEMRAALSGFKTVIRNPVIVTVGGVNETDVEMSLGAVEEAVTVRTEPPLVEATKTDLSRVVTTQEIETLPNPGRNFVEFVKLSSGVALGRENGGGGAFQEPDVGVGSAAAPRCRSAASPS